MDNFKDCFENLTDPRRGNAQRHELLDILAIALAACLSGAETCVDMALFGRSKEDLLRRYLRLGNGIPSHDTFSRLFRMLDPDGFEACFQRFISVFNERAGAGCVGGDIVAVDGKTARRSFDRQGGHRALHMVNAWSVEQRLVLGQHKVDGDTNEIEALPVLLAMLDIEGRMVTADAMHCQRSTAQAILDHGADYCLALKANQPTLFNDVRLLLDDLDHLDIDRHQTIDGDHGRIETRQAVISGDMDWISRTHGFPGLKAIGKITAKRDTSEGETSTATRYYLLSKHLSAARFAEVARAHWQVENSLHWVLDVILDEDASRARKDNAPENLARLRRFALNILRANSDKSSTRGKIKRAGWDDRFLIRLLSAA